MQSLGFTSAHISRGPFASCEKPSLAASQEVRALLGLGCSHSFQSSPDASYLSGPSGFSTAPPSEAQQPAAGPSCFAECPETDPSSTRAADSQLQFPSGMTFAQSASAPGWEDDDFMSDSPRSTQLAALPPQQAAVAEAVMTLLEAAGTDTSLHVGAFTRHLLCWPSAIPS